MDTPVRKKLRAGDHPFNLFIVDFAFSFKAETDVVHEKDAGCSAEGQSHTGEIQEV